MGQFMVVYGFYCKRSSLYIEGLLRLTHVHRPRNTFMTILVNERLSVSHAGQKTSVQGTEGSQRKFH